MMTNSIVGSLACFTIGNTWMELPKLVHVCMADRHKQILVLKSHLAFAYLAAVYTVNGML